MDYRGGGGRVPAVAIARLSSTPRRVLVLRFSSAGDVVLTAPAMEALRVAWPNTEIIFAVKEVFAPLLQHNPHLTRIVPLHAGEGVWRFSRRLKALDCDALLDLHGKIRSRILRALLPSPRRAVWKKRRFKDELPVRLMLRPYRAEMRTADRYHAAVEQLVGRSLPRGKLRYWVGEPERQEADRMLAALGIAPDRPLFGMAPGGNWATKRWPVDRFAQLAGRAAAAGMQVAVLGNAAELPLAEVVRAVVPQAHALTSAIPIALLAALIARCTVFAANDSGPMHLARALGVPTLAVFGSTDPGQFDFTGHARLFAGVPCAPCHFYGRKRCPKGHFRCMLDLEVETAWRELQPLLDGKRRDFVVG